MTRTVFCRTLSRSVAFLLILCILFTDALCFSVGAEATLPQKEPFTWKQQDPRWANTVIGVDPWTDSSGVRHREETVAHAGCFITSVAILCKSKGVALADGTPITPGTLAEALYDGGSCKYLNYKGAIVDKENAFSAVLPGVSFVTALSGLANPASAVDSYLSDPDHTYFLIARVRGGEHFVAIYGTSGKNILICDPGYDHTLLSEYNSFSFYLFEIDPAKTVPEKEPEGEEWCVVESVKVRSEPSLQSERVGSLTAGAVIEVYETVEADGYLWGRISTGWCALASIDGVDTFCVRVSSSKSVVYHLRNGAGEPAAQVKCHGVPLTISADIPVYEGHYFLGWSEDPDATAASYSPGEEYLEERALDLYDVWMDMSLIYGFGIDVSSHQGSVDWEKVAADGISFVILRAGTSSSGKDTRFEENYAGAVAAGLHVGSYFYTYATTEEAVEADVQTFLGILDGKTFDFPVYFDFETSAQAELGASAVTTLVSSYFSAMENSGYYAGVYASEWWFRGLIDMDNIAAKEHIWSARWPGGNRITSYLGDRCAIHQYSEKGKIDGISATVDLDICYINFPALIASLPSDPPGDLPDDPPFIPVIPDESKPLAGSGLSIRDGYLLGGKTGLSVRELRELFDGDITVLRGNDILGYNERAVTGCTLLTGSECLVIATRGDVNADGRIDAFDYMMLKAAVLGTCSLSGASYRSACLLSDAIDAFDYMLLKAYVLGTTDTL